MRVGGVYSFNGGMEAVTQRYSTELVEVYDVIGSVEAGLYKTKTSLEKTMTGRSLYHPVSLNYAYKQ